MYINFRTLKGQASHIYDGLVNTTTGEIIARSTKPLIEKRLNIKSKVNKTPSTDEDFIVLAARVALAKEVQSK
jgi:hypothetical protein